MKDAYWLPTAPDKDCNGRVGFRKVQTKDMVSNEIQYVLAIEKLDRHKEEDCIKIRQLAKDLLWK